MTIRQLIYDEEWDEARRLAHTLKGTAGALEIRAAADAARLLEDALAGHKLELLPELIDSLAAELEPAILAARGLDTGRRVAPIAPALMRAGAIDYGYVAAELAELRLLLLRRSLKARKLFDEIETRLGQSPEGLRLDPIREALAALDYLKAIAMLDELTIPVMPVESVR